MEETLSLEESRAFQALCGSNKLDRVKEWIRQGKSTRVHQKCGFDPLSTCVRKGFHDLLELLIRHIPTSQPEKDDHLLQSVRRQRFETVKLLVEHGANPLTVPFGDVAASWDPEMFRYFMAKGTDIFADDGLARALASRNQVALHFFLDYRSAHPEQASELQRQLDMALALLCQYEEEEWVSILVWAGGNPYARVPDLRQRQVSQKRGWLISAAEVTVTNHNLAILEALTLDPKDPEAQDILHSACQWVNEEAVHHLLNRGINPNDKENGGSSGLDTVFFHIDSGKINLPIYRDSARKCLAMTKDLIQNKARWRPDDHELRAARRSMCEAPELIPEFVKLLRKPGVCSLEVYQQLVGSPLMKKFLRSPAEIRCQ